MTEKLNTYGIEKMLKQKDLDPKLRKALEDKLKALKNNETINK